MSEPTTFSLLKELKDENRLRTYKTHGRLIPTEIWERLKTRRVCDECGIIVNYRMEVHHIIPISKNGTNEESNLKALCWDCHKIADKEAEPIRRPKMDWKHPKYYDHSKIDRPKAIKYSVTEDMMKTLTELKEHLKEVEIAITNYEIEHQNKKINGIKGQIKGLITTITKMEAEQNVK